MRVVSGVRGSRSHNSISRISNQPSQVCRRKCQGQSCSAPKPWELRPCSPIPVANRDASSLCLFTLMLLQRFDKASPSYRHACRATRHLRATRHHPDTRIRIETYETDRNQPKGTSRKELTFARLMSVSATCGWSSPSNCLRISNDSTVTSCAFTARQLSSHTPAHPFRPHIPPLLEYRHQYLGSIKLALVPI